MLFFVSGKNNFVRLFQRYAQSVMLYALLFLVAANECSAKLLRGISNILLRFEKISDVPN